MPSPTGTSSVTAIAQSGTTHIDAVLGPYQWTSAALTYSFPDFGSSWTTAYAASGEPWSYAFDTTSSSDRGYFAQILAGWANVSGLSFAQVSDSSTNVGEIRVAYSWISETDDAAAWAYYPSTSPVGGDIWLNAYDPDLAGAVWEKGSYGYFAVLHEMGHALGLKHPFSGSPTLPAAYDSQSYTVMSYAAANGDVNTGFSYYPTTPMLYDIAAIQYLYGVDTSYNASDTTYSFNDFSTYHETIWDGGGQDTIQYSGWWSSTIDLNAGAGSMIGDPVYVIGTSRYQTNNVWIAYGATIENATGGNGNDKITGNGAANALAGGEGSDSLFGGEGNDTLNGGNGHDMLYGNAGDDYFDKDSLSRVGNDTFVGGLGNDVYTIYGMDVIVENANEGTDTALVIASHSLAATPNVECLTLAEGSLAASLTGNDSNNVIVGRGGNDSIDGGNGSDTAGYYANRSLFKLTQTATGWTIDGTLAGCGIDTVTNTEYASFLDATVSLANIAPALNASLRDDTIKPGTYYSYSVPRSAFYDANGDALTYTATLSDGSPLPSWLVFDATSLQLYGTPRVKDESTLDVTITAADIRNATAADTLRVTVSKELAAIATDGTTRMGSSANNKLLGTAGADRIVGGAGADKLTGGAGADVFVFDNLATGGMDKITDFSLSQGDVLAFDGSVFTALAGGIAAGNVAIGAKATAADADDYLIFVTKGGKLYYDADGNGSTHAAVQIAGVKGSFAGIDYSSFVLDAA